MMGLTIVFAKSLDDDTVFEAISASAAIEVLAV
jgi:hypothetical protein